MKNKMSKKNAFTLIELIAVLVIMAILALIVTPLVMNIIKKARISADKRSIDAYGRSIELAIATYLLDEGRFPTSISDLTIEYSGDEVICSTTDLNSDSTIYLTGCTVAGRTVDYEYRTLRRTPQAVTYDAYEIGDEVSYNNVDYYVIADSDATEANVTLLKAEPLTASEITTYSAGTGAPTNGSGGMQYHASSSTYSTSYVKTTVDAWAEENAPATIEARLITHDELTDNLGYEKKNEGTTAPSSSGTTPAWVYNSNYWYWTMSPYNDSTSEVWYVRNDGGLCRNNVDFGYGVVRPVIVLSKSSL